MEQFVPNLDLSAFQDDIPEWTEEEMREAVEASERRSMGVGVHDITITGIVKDSVKISATDSRWITAQLVMENAAKEGFKFTVLVPMTKCRDYKGKNGKETMFAFAQFGKFATALQVDFAALAAHIIKTNCAGLSDLIGYQLRATIRWTQNKVHLEFDKTSNSSYLTNAKGERVSPEPFSIPEATEGQTATERYAEVEAFCRQHGFAFELWPNRTLEANHQIKNPPIGKPKKSKLKVTKAEDVDDDDDDDEEVKPEPAKKKKKKKSAPPPPPAEEPDDVFEEDDEDDDDEDEED